MVNTVHIFVELEADREVAFEQVENAVSVLGHLKTVSMRQECIYDEYVVADMPGEPAPAEEPAPVEETKDELPPATVEAPKEEPDLKVASEEVLNIDKATLRETLIALRRAKGIDAVDDLYGDWGEGAESLKTLKPEHYTAMYLAAKKMLEE